jgi:uncharacterized alkaline shock family protein YloU
MAELKEYVSQQEELGSIHISQEVIASIAAVAAAEVDGVTGIVGNKELSDKLGRKTPNPSKGVHLTSTEDGVAVNLAITVRSDAAVLEVANKVQDAVMTGVNDMTNVKVSAVNVRVAGVTLA